MKRRVKAGRAGMAWPGRAPTNWSEGPGRCVNTAVGGWAVPPWGRGECLDALASERGWGAGQQMNEQQASMHCMLAHR